MVQSVCIQSWLHTIAFGHIVSCTKLLMLFTHIHVARCCWCFASALFDLYCFFALCSKNSHRRVVPVWILNCGNEIWIKWRFVCVSAVRALAVVDWVSPIISPPFSLCTFIFSTFICAIFACLCYESVHAVFRRNFMVEVVIYSQTRQLHDAFLCPLSFIICLFHSLALWLAFGLIRHYFTAFS